MPISQENQVDFLFKKIGYSIAKTANTSTKSAAGESIASPLILRGDTIWGQSSSIPATPPSSTTGVVTVYSDANVNTVQTTEDITSPSKKTWKTNLTNWIDSSFGSLYAVKVYLDTTGSTTPQTTGTQLFPDGSSSNDFWFFDYSAGVLIFPDAIPTVVSSSSGKSIFVVGARYTGTVGIANYLPVYTGNITAGNVIANTFYGNLLATTISTTGIATYSGNIVAASSAPSISTTTGALVVTGGVGIGGNIYMGGTGLFWSNGVSYAASTNPNWAATANAAIYAQTTAYTTQTFYPTFSNIAGGNTALGVNSGLTFNATSGNLTSPAGLVSTTHWGAVAATTANVSGVSTFNGNVVAASTAVSINTTTGALVVSGGVGIAGNVYIGGSAGNAIVTSANIYSGNVTVANIATVGTLYATTGNIIGPDSNVTIAAGVYTSTFDNLGNVTVPNLTVLTDIVASKLSVTTLNATNVLQDRGSDAADWNLLTTMGTYLVNRSSWSGTSNTPTNTLNFTGLLEVLNASSSAIVQNYRPYDTNTVTNNYWTRTRFSGTWTSWIEVINANGYMDGGSY
jgi:hypothetical protein